MTLFKKSLALVLAFAMIFSTMSVMGFAANGATEGVEYYVHMNSDGTIGTYDGGNGIDFGYKFFRSVQIKGANTPDDEKDDVFDWVETDKAAPGEKVKARLYIGTDFPVYSSISTATLFDARFFGVEYSESSPFTVQTNGSYSKGLNISGNEAGGYKSNPYSYNKLRGDQSYFALPGVVTKDKVTSESYYVPSNFFYAEDGKTYAQNLITTTVLLSGRGAATLDPEDWIFELEFTVKDDSYVKTPGRKGFAKTPIEFANHKNITEESRAIGLIDVPEYPLGSTSYYDGIPMGSNDIYATTTPAYLTVYGNVIFDAVKEEGGYFEGNLETATKSGIIGRDKVDISGIAPKNDEGKVLSGWSLTKGGEVLTNTDYMDLFYDYEDITLYAVWADSEVTTYYTYEVYQMNPDGSYPKTPISQKITEEEGEVVKIELTDAPEGFVIDEDAANILNGVVNANNSTILRAYFARKQYTATYHYSDNNGAQKDEIKLYYGQEIPGFTAVEGGIPKLQGKDFIGWSLSETENIGVPTVMPNNDINIYPMYTDSVYTIIFDADGGKFADNSPSKSFVYKYGDVPAKFEEIPVKVGFEFSCWSDDLPATVTEDLTFTAVYNPANYKVSFADSKGNILDEVSLPYGSEITEDYIPDGYKADAWTDEDGVAVEFPFVLEESVTLTAADDANLYKVTFLVDGKVYEEYRIESGSDVVVPEENPKDKTGYKFAMWDPDPNGQSVDEEDLVFNAIFVKGEYVLSFNTDGGTAIAPITATFGDNIASKLPGEGATTKEGYTFIGWDTKLPETMPGVNTEVKALWSKNVYSVKFVNGLTGAEIKTVTGQFGDAVAAPALPEVSGYSFAWDVTPPATIPAKDESGKLMANGGVMTVTAVPTANDVTITFDTNGGAPATMGEIGGKAHADITPAITEPTAPEGMKFVGWTDESGNVVATPTKFPAESVKLTAKYENLVYEATYNADGGIFADGTTDNKTFKVEYGAEVPAPANPQKTNFVFKGWSPVVTTMPAKNVEFTAQWEAVGPVDYTITVYAVNPSDGSYLAPIVTNHKAEVGTKLQILLKGSNVPAGVTPIWYEDLYTSATNTPDDTNTSNVLTLEVKADGENNLVAYFKLTTYSAAFDANGGLFNKAPAEDDRYDGSSFTSTGTYGEAVELPVEPEKDGYDFAGWKDSETGFIYEDEIPTFATDVDYVAEWTIKTYDVTFTITDEEGKVVFEETVTFKHGDDVVAPDYDLPDGYEFDGWDVPAGTKAEDADKNYGGDAELKNYDVKYVASTGVPAGAAIPDNTTKTVKDKFAVGTATVPEGYEFDGWYINSETGAKAEAEYQMTAAPVTFYGKFTAKTYNINYNVNGGDYMASTPVVFGTDVDTIAVPTKEGNTFKGWVDGQGNAVTDEKGNVLDPDFKMPAGDLLLKATWEENATFHTVYYTFNIAGIADAPAAETNIQAGTKHTLAAAPKDTAEYRFTGWYYNNEKVTEIVMPASDAYIIGIWEPLVAKTYELTLDANGGTFSDGKDKNVSNHQVNADLSAIKAIKPTRNGYVFVEWTPALPATMPNSNLELKAKWEAEKYVINFNTDGGSTIPPMPVTFGEPVTAPQNPIKEGYDFVEWSPELPKVMGDIGENGSSMEVKAVWEAKKYPVSLNANGGLLSNGEETFSMAEVPFDTVLSTVAPVADPQRDGYKFLGWTTAGTTGYVTIPAKQPVGGIDYTAKWEALGNAIVFDADGGESVDDFAAKTGEKVEEVPVTTKEGYEFKGWMDESGALVTDKDGKFLAEFIMPADDVKLKASWQVKSAEVKYEYSGEIPSGLTPPEAKDYDFGTPVTVEAAPSAEGYTFEGWFVGNTLVAPGSTFKMGEDAVTFVGKWTKDEVDTRNNLVANANGGKYSDGTTSKNHKFNAGDMVDGVIEEPTRDGYEFNGWSGLEEDGTMPAGDTTITATWVAKVTIDPNGGTFADGSTAKIETKGNTIETEGKLPVTKENADFLGWKDTVSGTIYDEIPATSDVHMNLVAQWKDKEQKSITYYIGSKVHQTDSYYEGDAIVVPAAPTVEGFDFEGWKLKDGTDIPATMGNADLEAIAILNPHKNDVTFYYDAEKTQVYKEYKDVAYGSEIEVPADPTHPTNPKLVFAGWDPQVESEMPDQALEYVATWKEVGDKFKAHFVSDGKTVDLFILSEGAEIPEAKTPKKFGYKFVGWEPEVPDVMPAEDLTFEAQWEIDKTFVSVIIGGTVIGGGAIAGIVGTGAVIGGSIIGGILVIWGASELAKNTFTVTYKVDGEVYKTYKVLAGTKIPVPADPEKAGSEFAGWNPEVPEKMPKEDLVFEATWNADADVEIPSTGSFSGVAAFAAISAAGAIAILATKKKKDEDEE